MGTHGAQPLLGGLSCSVEALKSETSERPENTVESRSKPLTMWCPRCQASHRGLE